MQEVIANRGKTNRNHECTPGYYNFEGAENRRQDGNYNGGFAAYTDHIAAHRGRDGGPLRVHVGLTRNGSAVSVDGVNRTDARSLGDSLARTPIPCRCGGPASSSSTGCIERWDAAPVAGPAARRAQRGSWPAQLGLDVAELRSPAGVAALVGHGLGDDVVTVAQAYAGHQFGGFSPSLGDGRALLLGELVDRRRRAARPPPEGLGRHAVLPRR